jgi:hypothetical protein
MAELGMNVRQDGGDDPQELHDLGVRWVRFKPTTHQDLTDYVNDCHAFDPPIQVLLVVDGDSLTRFAADGSNQGPLTPDEAAAIYAARYDVDTCRVDAWELGNEMDHDLGDEKLTPEARAKLRREIQQQLKDLGAAFRAAMPDALLVTAGSDRSRPEFLEEANLTQFSVVAIHPYGAAPPNSVSPYGFGPVTGIVERFRDVAKTKKMKGKPTGARAPLWVTEWGVNWSDFGGPGASPVADAVKYQQEMMDYLRHTNEVEVAFVFCWSCDHVPPFGLHFDPGCPVPEAEADDRLEAFAEAIGAAVTA